MANNDEFWESWFGRGGFLRILSLYRWSAQAHEEAWQYPIPERVHFLTPVRLNTEISASVFQWPMPSKPMLKL